MCFHGSGRTAESVALVGYSASNFMDSAYEGAGAADIQERAARFQDTWKGREPEAVANFFVDFEKTLSYLAIDFPGSLASLIRTTNLLERFHKEMRRKQRDIGMFQSEQGCEALWYLLVRREAAKKRAMLQSRL